MRSIIPLCIKQNHSSWMHIYSFHKSLPNFSPEFFPTWGCLPHVLVYANYYQPHLHVPFLIIISWTCREAQGARSTRRGVQELAWPTPLASGLLQLWPWCNSRLWLWDTRHCTASLFSCCLCLSRGFLNTRIHFDAPIEDILSISQTTLLSFFQ